MLPLEIRKYLFDVQEACRHITEFVSTKSFSDYQNSDLLRSAVERQLEIVGEALNQMLKLDSSLETRIDNARRIIAFRNRLIHGYASVADEVVWGVVENYVPVLKRAVESLLRAD